MRFRFVVGGIHAVILAVKLAICFAGSIRGPRRPLKQIASRKSNAATVIRDDGLDRKVNSWTHRPLNEIH